MGRSVTDYVPHSELDVRAMLEAVGARSIDDLFDDIPEAVRKKLRFVPVDTVDEVLRVALAVDDPEAFFKRLSEQVGSDVFDDSAFKKKPREGGARVEEEEAKVH